MKKIIKGALRKMGYDLTPYPPLSIQLDELETFSDLTPDQKKLVQAVRPFTMTSLSRVVALMNAVHYISKMKIPGDIVECGVWRGGSMMATALSLMASGDTSRSLYLYDTYEGMSAPSEHDKTADGVSAKAQLAHDPKGTGIWCYASIDDVRQNVLSTGYPREKVHFIKGKVEDTIPGTLPGNIALLRLDTDWYESTRHELIHLFPLLRPDGILIIDDYGHWEGARKAVDEYFAKHNPRVFLHRIDNTGRIAVGSPLK